MATTSKQLRLPVGLTTPLFILFTACGGLESELNDDALLATELSSGGTTAKLTYTPVPPCRIVDTRVTGGVFSAGQERSYVVRDNVSAQGGTTAGCPSPVGEPNAVHLNVTVVPQSSGNIKVGPAGATGLNSSFINFRSGMQNVANAGIVKSCVDCAKDISLKANHGSAHVIVDVLGYFAPNTEALGEGDKNLVFTPVAPCRLADTRQVGGVLAPGETRSLRVHGSVASQGGSASGCPAPQGEPRAAHIKLVAVPQAGSASGNVAAFAKGTAAPAGSLFYRESGQNIANAVIVPTLHDPSAPEIEIMNRDGNTHMVVDVLGYYYENDDDDPPPGQDLRFVPATPCRIADTRHAGGTMFPNEELSLRVYGSVGDQGGDAAGCSAPLGEPRAVHLNMVAVPRSGAGNIAIDAANAGSPSVGTLNYSAAFQNIADSLTVRTAYGNASAPDVILKNRGGQADLVVDVLGYFYGKDDQPGPMLDGIVNLTADSGRTAATPTVSVSGAHRWVAWVEHDHTASSDVTSSTLRATRFDGAVQVAGPLNVASGRIMSPQVLAEGNGDAWLFWIQVGANGGRLKARHRTGDSWDSAPIDVAPGRAGYPAAHLDEIGDPWLVFEAYQVDRVEVQEVHWTGSAFASPVRLSQSGVNAYQPTIELDAEDALWVAWHAYVDSNYDVFARRRVGGSFGATWRVTDATDSAGHYLGHHQNVSMHHGCCGVMWFAWVSKGLDVRAAGTKPHLHSWVRDRRIQVRRVRPDGTRNSVHQVPVPIAALVHPQNDLYRSGPEAPVLDADSGKVAVFFRVLSDHPRKFHWRVLMQHLDVSNGRWLANPHDVAQGADSEGYRERPAVDTTAGGFLVAFQRDSRSQKVYPNNFTEPESDVLLSEVLHEQLGAATELSGAPKIYAAPLIHDQPRTHEVVQHLGSEYRLYTGSLHDHTEFSNCGTGNGESQIRDYYGRLRDVAALDFLAPTDHGVHMSNYDWHSQRLHCSLHNNTGGLSVLLGQEWGTRIYGHQNVIWPGCDGQLQSGKSQTTPEQVWSRLPSGGAITIPHHTAAASRSLQWDMRRFNQTFNRLFEIYQARGSFECYGCRGVYMQPWPSASKPWYHAVNSDGNRIGHYQDTLAKGYRMGVIASPDHTGMWGLAGVYAKSRSPADLFEALWNRRTFGVSNAAMRLTMEFRADGHLMGEEYQLASGTCPTLTGRVRTSYVDPETGEQGEIDQIKIFRVDVGQPIPGEHGEVFKLVPGNGEDDVSFTYQDAGCPTSGSAAYYLRAIQSGVSGIDVPNRPSIGWTSPVFVDWS